MISNDERREVAARLREQKPWSVFTDFQDCIGDLCDAVFDDEGDLNDMFILQKALSDLIEPEPESTCRNTTRHPHYGFECSECKWSAYEPNDYGNDVCFDDFNYCPNCGAKVLEVN